MTGANPFLRLKMKPEMDLLKKGFVSETRLQSRRKERSMKPTLSLIITLLLGPLGVSTSHAAEAERPATHFSTFAKATLHESPLLNRIKLAKQRGRSYPMDSLDFIMVDLERPEPVAIALTRFGALVDELGTLL